MRLWFVVFAVAACSKPSPKVLATIDGEVLAIAVDDAYVYAVAGKLGEQSIVRISKDGGDLRTIIQRTGIARSLAIDGGKIYWAETAIPDHQGSDSVYISADQVKQDGGLLNAVTAGVQYFARISVSSSDGTGVKELARFNGAPSRLMLDDTTIYVLSFGEWTTRTDDDKLDSTKGSLVKLPRTGGVPMVLADHLKKPKDLTLDTVSAFWTSDGVTWRIAKTGGEPERSASAPTRSYTDEGRPWAVEGSMITLSANGVHYHAFNKDHHATLSLEPSQ
jgi:hypothetical protein